MSEPNAPAPKPETAKSPQVLSADERFYRTIIASMEQDLREAEAAAAKLYKGHQVAILSGLAFVAGFAVGLLV